MAVLLMTFIIIFFIILNEKNNSLWIELSAKYVTQWKYIKRNHTTTLYFWKEGSRVNWFNHVLVDINNEGLSIYFPFFKRYLPSISIPWDDIEVKGQATSNFTPKLKCIKRLQFSIVGTDIQLTIPFRYMNEIKKMKKESLPLTFQ